MEGLSKGILLNRMEEEYRSMLSSANSSASSSKRIEIHNSSSSSIRQPDQARPSSTITTFLGIADSTNAT